MGYVGVGGAEDAMPYEAGGGGRAAAAERSRNDGALPGPGVGRAVVGDVLVRSAGSRRLWRHILCHGGYGGISYATEAITGRHILCHGAWEAVEAYFMPA